MSLDDAPVSRGSRRAASKEGAQRGLAYKILTRGAAALAVVGVLGLITLFVMYQRTEIPEPNADARKQISILYYDDGKTELARFNNTTRDDVPIKQVPKHVQHAFLSAEDRNFYDNEGVSFTGMARALWANVTGGRIQGGSTITQQYVKNYFLTPDKTLSRKVNEVMISVKIDNNTSKDQILQNYLNTIYFGRNAYGIQAASKAYFNKDVNDLTVSEGAFLASVINSPTALDPANGDGARTRVNGRMVYVLDGMVSEGWLSQAQRGKQQMPQFADRKRQTIPGPNGYLREMVQKELLGPRGLTQQDIDRGGLRITTTINKNAQESAVRAVRERLPDGKKYEDLHVGLTAQKPGDGAVVAVYGGRDPVEEANNATYQQMQAASGFKVFGLLAGLQDGMTLNTRYTGNSPMYFKEYKSAKNPAGRVTNFGYHSWGNVTLRKATANSVNTAFLQLNKDVGPKATTKAAEQAGIPKSALGKPVLANVLGTDSVRVMDMATAYNTIAGQGVKATPYMIKSVTSRTSDYSYKAKPKTDRVFDRAVALNTRSAMEDVIKYGSGAEGTEGFDRPSAGKTGTSNGNRAVWFNGFTPQLTASVGIFKSSDGGKTSDEMTNIDGIPNLTGGTFPTEIWTAFMEGALKGQKVEKFPKVPDLKSTFKPSTTRTAIAPKTRDGKTSEAPETSSEKPSETSTSEPSSPTSAPSSTSSPPSPSSTPKPTTPKPTSTRPPNTPTKTTPPKPKPTTPRPTRPTLPNNPSPPDELEQEESARAPD